MNETNVSDDATALPSVTLALFCYRQAAYIREALASALAQTYQPLEIFVSDDASPDDTFAIVEDMLRDYDGPHRITLNRNPQNLGIGAHVNRLMELIASDIVVIAAGDDISRPDRVAKIMSTFAADPDCHLVHSAARLADAQGTISEDYQPEPALRDAPTLTAMAAGNLAIIGATGAWRRETFDRFGPLPDGVVCEDLIIPFRAVMLGGIRYLSDPLVVWRRVGVSSDFQSKRGHDVLFGRWVYWQQLWRDAYRDRAADLRHFYGDAAPRDVLAICAREGRRYDSVVRLAESGGTMMRWSIIARLIADRTLPLVWRAKTGLMYAAPRFYMAFFDWKVRRGMMG